MTQPINVVLTIKWEIHFHFIVNLQVSLDETLIAIGLLNFLAK